MLSLLVFAIVAVVTVCSAAMIFIFRRLIHSVVAITFVFAGCGLIFMLLDQQLIAFLELLVFVGGISTYLIVAVAAEKKNSEGINIAHFTFLVALFSLAVGAFALPAAGAVAAVQQPADIVQAAAAALQSQYILIYFMVALLFGTVTGGILVIKRFTKLLI